MNKVCTFIHLSSGDVVVIVMELQVEKVKVKVVVATVVMLLLDVLELPTLGLQEA